MATYPDNSPVSEDTESKMLILANQLKNELSLVSWFKEIEDESQVNISTGAYLMLLIPLAEIHLRKTHIPASTNWYFNETSFSIDNSTIKHSLRDLIEVMAKHPAKADLTIVNPNSNEINKGPVRSSLSAIKAFWRRFCNIPPFCGGTDR